VRLRILGPLEVVENGRALDLGAHKQQALLGVLALRPREVVSTARLIDELWGESPPASAAKAVQGYVSGLRKALGGDAIVTRAGGYLVAVDPDALDAERFDQLVAAGRERLAPDPARAAATLREALALWRGDPLEGLRLAANARIEVQRLAERRLTALELRIEADLALGRHGELVGELQELAAVHPYREGLVAHLMLALYRSGRQAEALSAYRRARQQLAAELGLEPSESLRQLERQVLAQDPQLDLVAPEAEAAEPAAPVASVPPPPAPPAPPAPQHARRLVTVLAGRAAATDAEALHAVLERAGGVVERFGGTVERYLGDMVIGLFGLTQAREDDALRAVRAALELQGSDGEALRMGIESGEIFVGGRPGGATFATGAAITAAGRLAERAGEGQVLLGEAVRAAVAADVRVEAASGRLLELRSVRPGLLRVSRTPFVGRARELGELRAILARTGAARACHMVTILGPAGLGKSRLAAELLAAAGEEASVLVGRCRSDAEGVTYRVLAELVAQLGGDPRRRIAELLADDDQARGVLGAIGLSHEPAQAQEAFWAIRTLLERLARDRPLVVAIEDIHWAEPLLLDLLEYVVAFARSSPILLLCMARPELLEARPSWAAPQPDRSVLVLKALAQREATALVQQLGATGRISGIVRRAEGNPLFLEQLVAVDAEHLNGTLPASIQAVLAARIDGLEAGEADVLRHAAVEGRTFHAGAVVALLPEDERSSIDARLVALARKGLIHADRAEYAGEAAFRFDHALIRDAAYEAIPKRVRTELHVRIAEWIDVRTPGGSDEIVGYHLERACRLPAELGVAGERERGLAARAAQRFALAARSAQARGDPGAAARLLERGASLLDAEDPARAALLPALGAALFDAGRQADADRVLTEALRRTRDPRLSARAEVEQQFVRLLGEASTGTVDARRVAGTALRVLQEHGDEHGQSRAWSLHATIAWFEGRAADADDAWQRAAALARRTRDERELFDVLGWRASAAVFGPTPVREAIRRCTEIRETVRSSAVAVALTLHPLATLHAMSGEFEQARLLLREANEILHELGGMQSAVSHHEAVVERLAGRHASAEALLREGYARLAEMGDGTLLATTAAMLAQAVHARGDLEEAEQLCLVSRRGAPEDDILTQVIWRGVQARILAQRASLAAAERLAREAVALIARTDFLTHHGDALLDLAEVLRLADRPEDSYQAARAALSLYERKGNIVAAERAITMLKTKPEGGR
jgi:DNA-binding SARP family transcriptional activator